MSRFIAYIELHIEASDIGEAVNIAEATVIITPLDARVLATRLAYTESVEGVTGADEVVVSCPAWRLVTKHKIDVAAEFAMSSEERKSAPSRQLADVCTDGAEDAAWQDYFFALELADELAAAAKAKAAVTPPTVSPETAHTPHD